MLPEPWAPVKGKGNQLKFLECTGFSWDFRWSQVVTSAGTQLHSILFLPPPVLFLSTLYSSNSYSSFKIALGSGSCPPLPLPPLPHLILFTASLGITTGNLWWLKIKIFVVEIKISTLNKSWFHYVLLPSNTRTAAKKKWGTVFLKLSGITAVKTSFKERICWTKKNSLTEHKHKKRPIYCSEYNKHQRHTNQNNTIRIRKKYWNTSNHC